MPTTWKVQIDWDRNGNFTDTIDDVTNYVISANWFLGMRKVYQDYAEDGMLELVLDNSTKRFSPENTASPLYDAPNSRTRVQPFRPVRVVSHDGVTERVQWIGWIERVEPMVGVYGKRQVTITAAGPMQFFKAAETDLELQENQRTDQIIAQLIQKVVIPPAVGDLFYLDLSRLGSTSVLPDLTDYSILDQGRVTLAIAADNWVNRDGSERNFNVYKAIADVAAAERGRFLFNRAGQALFWNRVRLQDDIVPSWTVTGEMSDVKYEYASPDDLKNEIVVTCHPRSVGETADEILWTLDKPVTVQPGKEQKISIKYGDKEAGNVRIGAKDVTLEGVAFTSGSASVTLEAKANSATLVIKNESTANAVLKSATVRGRKITDYGKMEATAYDGISAAYYGRRQMRMNIASMDDLVQAEQTAQYELARRKEPRGMIRSLTVKSHAVEGGGPHAQQLARTLGHTLTISESQTGHTSKRYVIIGEAHRLSEGGELLETTWYLEPIIDQKFPWKLASDPAARTTLGTNTYLGF
jgi:hypothetical protein